MTPLAQVTPWLPLATLREVVDRALSVERRVQLDFKPLRHQEILSILLQYPPVPSVKVHNLKRRTSNFLTFVVVILVLFASEPAPPRPN